MVAVKAPKNASAERRFRRSAVLSGRINHPNVAKTLDFFDAGGRDYLVEEFLDGEDLSKARERLDVMDPYLVAHILHHMAKGVAASHRVKVVHRDLKPSNIMLSGRLTFDVVKVTDFGIAKMTETEVVDAVEGGSETITTSSTVMGALPYLSPEMAEKPRTAGPPTDIWSLGAMAFELLTGDKPFGKGLLAVPRILAAQIPSLPAIAMQNSQFSDLSQAIYGVIVKCLQKDPPARPTADQLVVECETLCYPVPRRVHAVVVEERPTFGFMDANGTRVVFHKQSVYGPIPRVGEMVLAAPHDGNPYPRAHPVLAVRLPVAQSGIAPTSI